MSVQGVAQTHSSARFFNNLGERDSWVGAFQLLTDAFGEDETRMLREDATQAVRSREVLVLRFRPDLSRVPETTSSQ